MSSVRGSRRNTRVGRPTLAGLVTVPNSSTRDIIALPIAGFITRIQIADRDHAYAVHMVTKSTKPTKSLVTHSAL